VGDVTTAALLEAWRGAPVRTRRRSNPVTLTTTLALIVRADAQRIRIAIQNTSNAPVQLSHSNAANSELPVTIPAQALYLEDFEDDDDQVCTDFWASSTGLDQFGNAVTVVLNVVEIILL
jgi:hypothetical protein